VCVWDVRLWIRFEYLSMCIFSNVFIVCDNVSSILAAAAAALSVSLLACCLGVIRELCVEFYIPFFVCEICEL
jgi:hypothetical protein